MSATVDITDGVFTIDPAIAIDNLADTYGFTEASAEGRTVRVEFAFPTTEAISESTQAELEGYVEDVFGTDDHNTHLSYSISGAMFVTTDPSADPDNFEVELANSIANALGIDAADVTLSYNVETGRVDYTI